MSKKYVQDQNHCSLKIEETKFPQKNIKKYFIHKQ